MLTIKHRIKIVCLVATFVYVIPTYIYIYIYTFLQRDICIDIQYLLTVEYRIQIVCLVATFIGIGDVEGDGASILYITKQNANHFVPLLNVDAVEDDEPGPVQQFL